MKFGILNATRNASISRPAPNMPRIDHVAQSPVTRDRSVKAPTIEVLRKKPPRAEDRDRRGEGGAGRASCGADYAQAAWPGAVAARRKRH